MKTSRQRLLEMVQARKIVSAGELSRALQMTEANARHHLAILQEQGLVQIVGERAPEGKGRPTLLFGPSQQMIGDNLDKLASALLTEMTGDGWVERVSGRMFPGSPGMKDGTSPTFENPKISGGHLTQRLMQAVGQLNELHYQARWEAHMRGPRLILGNCPYRAVIDEHPTICQVDAALVERLAGTPVEQIAKLARDRQGGIFCSFRILEGRRTIKGAA